MKIHTIAFNVGFVLLQRLWAQLPPDQMVVSSGQLLGAEPGQRNGTFVVAQINQPPVQVDGRVLHALAFDPYDGTVLMGWAAYVFRVVLQGATISSSTTLGVLSADNPTSMRFDEDGNVIVLGAYWNGTRWESQIHRVARTAGAVLLQTLPFVAAAMDIDERTGIAYLVRNPGADVYRVDPPYTGPAVLTRAYSASAFGIGFVPLGAADQLLIPTTSRSFLVLDLASHAMTLLPSTIPFPPFNPVYHLQYHGRSNTLWGIQGGNGVDIVWACNPGPQRVDATRVTDLGLLGSPTAMTMNGIPAGSLYVAPMSVPQQGFRFEAGVWGRPGELALLVMTRPFVQVVAVGLCDAAGVLAVKFPVPAGAVLPGAPGQLEFQGATVDLQTLALTLSPPKPWPRN